MKNGLISALLLLFFCGCSIAPQFSREDQDKLVSPPLPYVKSSPYSESLHRFRELIPLSPYYDAATQVVVQIKPVANKTACKQLPLDLTDMLQTAGNRVGGSLLIAPYHPNYLILEAQTGSKITKADPVLVIDGSITECDEKIEETSVGVDGNISFTVSGEETDVKAKQATQRTYSRIALDLHLVDHQKSVLLPEKQTSMAVDVWDIKKYRRFGFQVMGSGVGLDGRRNATQEKHNAVRTLVDLSMLQLLGKYFEVPYWLVIEDADPDPQVMRLMKNTFVQQTPRGQLILVQKALAWHGYDVTPNGIFDNDTKKSLADFASRKGLNNPEIHVQTYTALVTTNPVLQTLSTSSNETVNTSIADLPVADPINMEVAFVYSSPDSTQQHVMQHGSTLRSGDHYKIVFKPESDCYLYVFQVDSAGRLYMLFPLEGNEIKQHNPLSTENPVSLPGEGDSFILDNQTGEEKIFLLASTERDPVVEQLKRYFSDNTLPELRRNAEQKLGVYLFSKQRLTEMSPGQTLELDDNTQITTNKIESLNNSRIFELSFRHR